MKSSPHSNSKQVPKQLFNQGNNLAFVEDLSCIYLENLKPRILPLQGMDGCGHISFQASLASSTGANAATEGYLVFPDFSVLESPKKSAKPEVWIQLQISTTVRFIGRVGSLGYQFRTTD